MFSQQNIPIFPQFPSFPFNFLSFPPFSPVSSPQHFDVHNIQIPAKISAYMNERSPFPDPIYINPPSPKRGSSSDTSRILIHPVPQESEPLNIPISHETDLSEPPIDSPSPNDTALDSAPDMSAIEQTATKNRKDRLIKLCLEHENLINKIRAGEYVPLSRLLFTIQGLERLRDVGHLSASQERQAMAEAQFRFALVELRKMRANNATDDEMYRAVLDRFYNPDRFRYKLNDNDLFRAFAPEPRPDHKGRPTGNCESRATAMAALLEAAQVGNHVLLETFSDHVRVVAEDRDGNRFVLENAAPTPYTPTPGTKLVPLSDIKNSIAGVPATGYQVFELGSSTYHGHGTSDRNPKSKERTVKSVAAPFGGERPFGVGSNEDAPENPTATDRAVYKLSSVVQPTMETIYSRLFDVTRGHLPTISNLKRTVPAVIAGLFLTGGLTHAQAENVSTPEEAVDLIHRDTSRLTELVTSIAEKIEQALTGKDPHALTVTVKDPEDKPFQPKKPDQKFSINTPQEKTFTVFLVDEEYKKRMVDLMVEEAFTFSKNDFLSATVSENRWLDGTFNVDDHVRTTDSDFWEYVMREMNTALNEEYRESRNVEPEIRGMYTIHLNGKNLDPVRVMASLERGARLFERNWNGSYNRTYYSEIYPPPNLRGHAGSLTVYVNNEAIIKNSTAWGGELVYDPTPTSIAWENEDNTHPYPNTTMGPSIPQEEIDRVRSEVEARFGISQ